MKYIKDNKARVDLPYGVAYLQPHELGKQIGYDATYSDEYRKLKGELQATQSNYESVTQSIQLAIDYNVTTEPLLFLQSRIVKDIQAIESDLEALKQTSWMNKGAS